jgi:hypothetical protein
MPSADWPSTGRLNIRLTGCFAMRPSATSVGLALACMTFLGACSDRAAPPTTDTVAVNAPPVSPAPASGDTTATPDATHATSCPGKPGRGVTVYGIGALCAGMTVAEARAALKEEFSLPTAADAAVCTYAAWPQAPLGVMVMLENSRVARVDVNEPGVTTTEGIGVGDTEARIMSVYGGRVTGTPHKYTNGKYLSVAPMALADSAFRIVFEVENGTVIKYRAGLRPQVDYVEGCS